MVCDECKKEIEDNPMYKEFGFVVVCNHNKWGKIKWKKILILSMNLKMS